MFDRFRFDAKRKRDESTLGDLPNVEGIDEDIETIGATGSAKRGKTNINATESARECFSQERGSSCGSSSSKWQERWHAICDDCFEHVQPCEHYPEHRLRLLIVGHNPSDHAWKTGYSYSNPTNRMWMMLTGTLLPQLGRGIVPSTAKIAEQNAMPLVHGVGFTSIGLKAGNDASKYGKATMEAWRNSFFVRLRRHAARVCLCDHNIATDAAVEHLDGGELTKCQLAHAPMLVAFSGKRQFSWLFSPPLARIKSYGRQTRFPPGWPQELRADSEIWVLPSSSGRAAMTTAQRALPYQELAERVHQIPWSHGL
uniref:Uracil-DNA glycosylase-like domain-containing protein n=1 Tax=Hyaloperonospora arabidopsidis (strain Emoy2) TaxID=559515 RepID=M4C476_HYAAE